MKDHVLNRTSKQGSTISDEALCGALDTCLALTKNERAIVIAGMAKLVELGKLPRRQRDWLFAIAKAHKLFGRTEAKPAKNKPLGIDGQDTFSTRKTAGTEYGERILRNRPLKPPGRRSAA